MYIFIRFHLFAALCFKTDFRRRAYVDCAAHGILYHRLDLRTGDVTTVSSPDESRKRTGIWPNGTTIILRDKRISTTPPKLIQLVRPDASPSRVDSFSPIFSIWHNSSTECYATSSKIQSSFPDLCCVLGQRANCLGGHGSFKIHLKSFSAFVER